MLTATVLVTPYAVQAFAVRAALFPGDLYRASARGLFDSATLSDQQEIDSVQTRHHSRPGWRAC